MRLIFSAAALVLLTFSAMAGDVTGLWLTQNHGGVVEISPCGGGLCGRIVGQPTPVLPDGSLPRDWRGQVECGLDILDVKPTDDPNLWRGMILDPRDGRRWRSEISLDANGNLRLRGYVLTPLLGETQIWTRFEGQVREGCGMG